MAGFRLLRCYVNRPILMFYLILLQNLYFRGVAEDDEIFNLLLGFIFETCFVGVTWETACID